MKRISVLLSVFAFNLAIAQVPTTINVEVDWMVDSSVTSPHSHRPNQSEIDAVVQMFACHGITLNVDFSNAVAHVNVLQPEPNPPDTMNFFNYSGPNSYGAIKNANFSHISQSGWHYCLLAHDYTDTAGAPTDGSSGLGQTPGRYFLVTMGSFNQIGTAWDRASTFAHELGHNLNLNHNGSGIGIMALQGNYSPNVPSIMTYFYQLRGVKANLECQGLVRPDMHLYKNLDYSNGRACQINESSLGEPLGMGISSVDWDCSGLIGGTTAVDLSNSDTQGGWCFATTVFRGLLTDYDEWSNIQDVTSVLDSQMPVPKNTSCITFQESQSYASLHGTCAQPPVVNEPCTNNQMIYLRVGGSGDVGSCNNPYTSIVNAYNVAINGDIIYVHPGNYPATGLVLNKQLIITAPAGAIIGQ